MKLITALQTVLLFAVLPVIISGSGKELYQTDTHTGDAAVTGVDPIQENYIEERLAEIEDLIKQGNLQQALEILDETESNSRSLAYEKGIAKSAAHRGDIYISQGRYADAIDILSDAYSEFEDSENGLKLGNLLASAYRFNNDLDRSLNLYNKLIEESEGEADPVFRAGLEQNVAVVYEMLGDTKSAMERYYNSLEIAENKPDTTLLILVTNNIGELYRKEGDIDLAEQFIMRSLVLSKDQNVPEDMSRAYNNLGLVSRMKQDYGQALDYYRMSLEIADKMGSIVRPVQILFNIGYIYMDQGQYDLAREAFLESLEKSRELNISRGIYHNSFGLGDVYTEFEDYELAMEHYNRALEMATQMSVPEMEKDVLERIWKLHEKTGRFEEAFSYLKQYNSVSDSLQALDKDQAIARYETLFKLRNERGQNELLQEKLQAQRYTIIVGVISIVLLFIASILLLWMYRKQRLVSDKLRLQHAEMESLYKQVDSQKKELSKLNETKDKLFSILGHDLRSPISKLQSLVMLLREDEADEIDTDQVLSKVELQLQYSISTLENYLNWAQSQMKGIEPEMKLLKLHDEVDSVLDIMGNESQIKNIRLQNRVDENVMVSADKGMLFIILKNLISNALKFSQTGSQVVLNVNSDEDRVVLSVQDYGVGISEEDQEKLFSAFNISRKGTSDEKGTGLGLLISRELTEMQNGRIWFESAQGEGTVFYVEFEGVEETIEV